MLCAKICEWELHWSYWMSISKRSCLHRQKVWLWRLQVRKNKNHTLRNCSQILKVSLWNLKVIGLQTALVSWEKGEEEPVLTAMNVLKWIRCSVIHRLMFAVVIIRKYFSFKLLFSVACQCVTIYGLFCFF